MPQEVTHFSLRSVPLRILLILILVAAGVWSYFAVRWYIGNTLAEYFSPTESNLRTAEMAESMAPDDPLTHWRIGQVSQKTLPLDQLGPAIAEYEKAVSLSPHEYRFWMSLGTAHEQSGDPVKAELALATTKRLRNCVVQLKRTMNCYRNSSVSVGKSTTTIRKH